MSFEAPSRLEVLEKESAQFYQNWHKVRREKEALEVKIDELRENCESLKRAARVILTWVEVDIEGPFCSRDKSDIANLLRKTLKLGDRT